MKKIVSLSLLLLLACCFPVLAMEVEQLENINYSFGHSLGTDLAKAALPYRIDQMLDGLYDGTEGIEPLYEPKQMQKYLKIKKTEDEDLLQKANYSFGFKVGSEIKAVEIEFLPEPFLYGATDVVDKKPPRLSKKEMTQLLQELKKDKS